MIHTLLQATEGPTMMQIVMAAPVASFIFAITIATSLWAFYNDTLYANLILHPASVSKGQRVYTVITSGMIHADYMHLFFNMLSYYFFAFTLEAGTPSTPGLGHWQFGVLYVVSLILSDLPTVYKHRNDDWYHSLGASGAVSAVVFSAILYHPFDSLYVMFIPIPIYSIVYGALYLIYCNYASKRATDNINHDAHMFGALSGLLLTIILHPHIAHDFLIQISAKVQSLLH
jgi:membrane associated rhomboid family serine protease